MLASSKAAARWNLPLLLSAISVLSVAALGASTVVDASRAVTSTLQVLLLLSFTCLAIIDFPAAVAIVLTELVVGGAGGRWTTFPASVSGRTVLDAIVLLRALTLLVGIRKTAVPPLLGRYGLHALIVALVVGGLGLLLGVINGHPVGDAFADGNGVLFLAFIVTFVAILRESGGRWLRDWLFRACALNAVLTTAFFAASLLGIVTLPRLRDILLGELDMGGVIGVMPNGAHRIFLGSGLYLQVGLAILTPRVVRTDRRVRDLLIYGCLLIALVATYTRGLWLGGVIAVSVVLVLAATARRALIFLATVSAIVALTNTVAAAVTDFSLLGYVSERAKTIAASGDTLQRSVRAGSFEESGAWKLVDRPPKTLVKAQRTTTVKRDGVFSQLLTNTAADEDDYAYQEVIGERETLYEVSAWALLRGLRAPATAGRALLAWDGANGRVYTARARRRERTWTNLSVRFRTGVQAGVIEIRLYAPRGTVYWDDVRLRRLAEDPHRLTPGAPAPARTVGYALPGERSSTDVAGEVSNEIRVEQARILARQISARPVLGHGFGAIAKDYPFGTSYRYELSYLDLLFKTGIVGFILFLSFYVRLLVDSIRARFAQLSIPVPREEAAVPLAIIVSVLLTGASNPYILAAFGVVPVLACIGWLDPIGGSRTEESVTVTRS